MVAMFYSTTLFVYGRRLPGTALFETVCHALIGLMVHCTLLPQGFFFFFLKDILVFFLFVYSMMGTR